MVNNIIPACKDEIMSHKGKLLIRPDSGDMVDISIRTIEKLWEVFGGTVNSKGYKVLDPHIGLIYGDGCTLNRVADIYRILEERGFAANNVVFGVGAFCFHALFDENDKMTVITRDTFGMAMKATFGEFGDNKLFIYKDPKTDDGNLKKSHKGCCMVGQMPNGEFWCSDELNEWVPDTSTCLKTVFKDGNLTKFDNFMDIRRRMYDCK
jgi:nicotinamide phosphoribosyltransferase